MLTLDSLSLLLSKQNPTHASLTLSQQLREMVGIGTMGADKLDDSNITSEKTKDQQQVAVGWTLMEINRTRDAAQEATAFLQAEMEAEGKYWQDIMAVKSAGWSICRVPQQRSALGVRFGFSEAAPEFKANGLAPLRRSDDGQVEIDSGRIGGRPERLVVTYEHSGQVVGRIVPPTAIDDAIQTRVLSARDTIFAQELWHELTREARTLAAYDVHPGDKRLTCPIDASSLITIELLPVQDCPADDPSLPQNAIAQTISAALHILLTYAHRCNELFRVRPLPPHIPRSRGQQIYTLLRPIIARLMHTRNIDACTAYTGNLVSALKAAGLPASFTLQTPQPELAELVSLSSTGTNQLSSAMSLIRNLLQPTDFTISLTILPSLSLTIRGRTYLVPVTATYYHVLAPADSPLHRVCAPYADGYPDLRALADYLRTATARLLATHYISKLNGDGWWTLGIQGTSICEAEDHENEVRFAIQDVQEEGADKVKLVVTSTAECSQSWSWPAERETVDVVVDMAAKKMRS
jgi:mediator of RNA polymerase II transcription subunit 17